MDVHVSIGIEKGPRLSDGLTRLSV